MLTHWDFFAHLAVGTASRRLSGCPVIRQGAAAEGNMLIKRGTHHQSARCYSWQVCSKSLSCLLLKEKLFSPPHFSFLSSSLFVSFLHLSLSFPISFVSLPCLERHVGVSKTDGSEKTLPRFVRAKAWIVCGVQCQASPHPVLF